MAVELTHQQSLNREKDIQDELERLKNKTDKTAEDHAKVPALLNEFRSVHQHRLDLEHDMALSEVRSATKAEGTATSSGIPAVRSAERISESASVSARTSPDSPSLMSIATANTNTVVLVRPDDRKGATMPVSGSSPVVPAKITAV